MTVLALLPLASAAVPITDDAAFFEQKAELRERGEVTTIFLDAVNGVKVTVTNDRIVHLEKVRRAL